MFRFIKIIILIASTLQATTLWAVSVTDDTGLSIHLPKPAQRIISLSPHTTELLFAIGAGKQLVAVSDYSDYPQAANRLPSIGGAQGLDLERIIALKPDLVVAWQSGNASGQLDVLARMGIPIFRSEPRQLESIATSLERLGQLSGHSEEAQRAATIFRLRSQSMQQTYAKRKPIRVFYQIWDQPLMTVGGRHLINELITLCGGQNIFAEIASPASLIDAETVIAADPQIMVISSPKKTPENMPPESLLRWEKWPKITAVRNHQYLVLDPSLITRNTPRVLEGTEQLCLAIEKARK